MGEIRPKTCKGVGITCTASVWPLGLRVWIVAPGPTPCGHTTCSSADRAAATGCGAAGLLPPICGKLEKGFQAVSPGAMTMTVGAK